jgi:2-methylisocitrate lyase-like PEP mutase family enzyme
VQQALERATAYKEAGADGFFVPLLGDLELIRQLCAASPLPVNIIWLDGLPAPKDLAAAGVARISYGPGPYLKMLEWLKSTAQKALALED